MPNVIRDVLSSSDSRLMVPLMGPHSVLFRWVGDRSQALALKNPLVPSGRPPSTLIVAVLASLFSTRCAMSFWRSTLKHKVSIGCPLPT